MIVNPGVMWNLEEDDIAGAEVYRSCGVDPKYRLRAIGIWGTCNVALTSRGDLMIGPGYGADAHESFANSEDADEICTGPWAFNADYIRTVRVMPGCQFPEDCRQLFAHCPQLERVELGDADMSAVVSMDEMFEGCGKLKYLFAHNPDFASLESAEDMLHGCLLMNRLEFGDINVDAIEILSKPARDLAAEKAAPPVPPEPFGVRGRHVRTSEMQYE